jgi:Amt family ammonium transporter
LIAPDEFIPLAEESGVIVAIGQWVLREACRVLRELEVPGGTPDRPLAVSVNLSAHQLHDETIIKEVADVLAETGLEPQRLWLEITETAMVQDAEHTVQVLQQLKELGVRLLLDDFGKGYSSLSYLVQFPLDGIKIDRSFVSANDCQMVSQKIVRSVTLLAHNLELGVTAEGIETEDQLQNLRKLGCDCGQGYLFSRPVEASRIPGVVEALATMTKVPQR